MTFLSMFHRYCLSNRATRSWLPVFVIGLLLFSACGEKSGQTAVETDAVLVPKVLETRFDEVRAIHDEVMPERGNLIRLQRKIAAADLSPEEVAFAKTRLERADDMMMDWMYADRSLVSLIDSLSTEEIDSYLNTREKSINAVADSMRAAMRHAESILAQ